MSYKLPDLPYAYDDGPILMQKQWKSSFKTSSSLHLNAALEGTSLKILLLMSYVKLSDLLKIQ